MRMLSEHELAIPSGGSGSGGGASSGQEGGLGNLPAECSVTNLEEHVAAGGLSGLVGGLIAGAASGPGAIITVLGGGVLGAGMGAAQAATSCAIAYHDQQKGKDKKKPASPK